MWMEVHTYSVKAKSLAGNMWVKDKMTKRKAKTERKSARDLKFYAFCRKIQQRALAPKESTVESTSIYDNTSINLQHLTPKSCWNFV